MAGLFNTGIFVLYSLFLAAGNTTPPPLSALAVQQAPRTRVPVQYVRGRYTP